MQLLDIKKSFGSLKVLDGLDMTIEQEKTTVILGPSGSGKTTLLNIISGLDKDFRGEIKDKFIKLSYVFQEDRLLEWRNARENIEFVLDDKEKYKEIVDSILDILELKDRQNYSISQLSGGQKQRVAIARAFCYPSDMVIMDEPFKSLDPGLKIRVITDFNKLILKEKKTVLFVTHDVKEAVLIADTIYIFSTIPARVVKKIELRSLKETRKIGSYEMLELESEIYSLLS